jgi:hypothetical protein
VGVVEADCDAEKEADRVCDALIDSVCELDGSCDRVADGLELMDCECDLLWLAVPEPDTLRV